MFFSSIKEIKRLLKEVNRLLSNGISSIYWNVTIDKTVGTSKLQYSKFKTYVSKSVFGSSKSKGYHWFFKVRVAT